MPCRTRRRFPTVLAALFIGGIAAIPCLALAALADEDQAPASTYREGVAAFEEGEFARAIALFGGLVEAGRLAPDVFYNLGNALYRADDPGSAALQYRRATVLDPRHPEARQNLRFLRREYGFVESSPEPLRRFVGFLPWRVWWYVATSGAWLTCLALVSLLVLRRFRVAAGLAALAGATILAVAATAIIARSRFLPDPSEIAVVTKQDSRALTAPAPDAGSVIELPPGSEVRILEERGPWRYVAVGQEDVRGWVRNDRLQPLWPYDPHLIP